MLKVQAREPFGLAMILVQHLPGDGDFEAAGDAVVREGFAQQIHAANERASCAYMKVTTLPKVRAALLNLEHRITVEPEVAAKARRAIERMIAIGGKGGASLSPATEGFDPGE